MLSVRILGRTVRSNSLPSGHTDLHRRHPGLKENLLEGVLVAKMPSASFRPEVIEHKVTKDVEVSEAVNVIHEEPR